MGTCSVCGRYANLNWLDECWKCSAEIEQEITAELGNRHERCDPRNFRNGSRPVLRRDSDQKSA